MIVYICRFVEDLGRVAKLKIPKEDLLIVSDSAEVHNLAFRYSSVSPEFLTQMFSFSLYKDHIFAMIEEINEGLTQCDKVYPPEVISWTAHLEGGECAQLLMNSMILIDSLEYLLQHYSIQKVVIAQAVDCVDEDSIIVDFFKGHEIQVVQLSSWPRILYLFLHIRFRHKVVFGKKILIPIFFLRWLQRTILDVRLIRSYLSRDLSFNLPDIVFCSAGEHDRFVSHIVPVMKAFEAKGQSVLAICWGSPNVVSLINEKYGKAINLEGWISFEMYLKLKWNYWCAVFRVERAFFGYLKKKKFSHKNVELTQLIYFLTKNMVAFSYYDRAFLWVATNSFFKKYQVKAIKLWGGDILPFGRYILRIFKRDRQSESEKGPVLFNYNVGLSVHSEVVFPEKLIDIHFAVGEDDRNYLLSRGESEGGVVISGFPQFEYANPEVSETLMKRSFLQEKLRILVITSGVLPGFVSLRESRVLIASAIQFAIDRPNVDVVIKLHPNVSNDYAMAIFSEFGSPSNVQIRQLGGIFDYLKNTDIVVAKYSTVVYQAIECCLPVISLVIDSNPFFYQIYDGGVELVISEVALRECLYRLADDYDYRVVWSQKRVADGLVFLANKHYHGQELPECIIASHVLNYRASVEG